ncbi:MAG: sigma70-ECF: polymerase sigma factor, sigma-70 family [Sporomusa sp.]|jgi:RNA polymerase sigma-70 factor (ECF subfamily)|nr:sigma70-ECF: polymerase sigma factor, sigma-70 family [Sporomusa sp.]
MKIKYEFLTGEAVEIEVSEAIGKVLIGIDKEAQNSDRRESRRHNSIDAFAELGVQFATADEELVASIEARETKEALRQALDKLLPQQRKLLQIIYFGDQQTIADVAREEGVTVSAISHRLDLIYKKLRKLLNQNQ